MGWYFLGGFILGLLCHISINKPADIEVYKQGFTDGAEAVRKELRNL